MFIYLDEELHYCGCYRQILYHPSPFNLDSTTHCTSFQFGSPQLAASVDTLDLCLALDLTTAHYRALQFVIRCVDSHCDVLSMQCTNARHYGAQYFALIYFDTLHMCLHCGRGTTANCTTLKKFQTARICNKKKRNLIKKKKTNFNQTFNNFQPIELPYFKVRVSIFSSL